MKRTYALATPADIPSPAAFANANSFGAAPRDIDVPRLWQVLVRRRVLFFSIVIGIVAIVAVLTMVRHKTYTTGVKMIAGKTGSSNSTQSVDTNLPVLNALLTASGAQSSETYAELLHEAPISAEVIKRLNLKLTPDELLSHVAVKPITNTAIIGVDVTSQSAEESAQIANMYATVFVDRERSLVAHQADSAIGFLQTQIPIAEQKMRTAQNALRGYEQRYGIADLPTQTTSQLTQAALLDSKASQAEMDGRMAGAQLASVQSQLATTPRMVLGQDNVVANPVAMQLAQQIAQAQASLDAARKQYTESHPTVVAGEHQLASLQAEAAKQKSTVTAGTQMIPNLVYQQLAQQAATLRAQVQAAQSQSATARSQRQAMQSNVTALPERQQRIASLQRDSKAAEDVYTTLQKKYADASLSSTTALSDVTITQQADPAFAKVSPNVALNIGAALIIGIILGLGSVYGLEFLDDRFRTEEDVKERLGVPVLASIPALPLNPGKSGAAAKNGDPGNDDSWLDAMAVESYLELVTALRYSSATAPRSIAITSPHKGDGKSTIAVNIAVSMAQLNARVLIIDADLRRPTIHTKLDLQNNAGLTDVLVGLATFSDAVRPSGHEGVWTLTSGTRAPNPLALIQGEAFDRLLQTARDDFDFVIIDSPALEPIIDGAVLGMKADGTVLVISAAQTDGRAANVALEKLSSVGSLNLIGVVLNRTKPERRAYSEYYLGAGHTVSISA